ncbi:hypothetical protein B0I27_11635 [Arcticibacter pallidicorallinus]|uniref:Endosialidase-like protein n=2 Tax=Arcticibacter pallidicorallinus TaxID=1259464 RepID=A0A2T0TR34_9SPHI|nr:hypothetical protein B0I27_11635 [Arcticibacter pallidicorallinus]
MTASLCYSQNTNTWPASGNVGIGTTNPLAPLDVSGNIILRNYQNVPGGGASILFTPFGDDYTHGPRIRSYLDYAAYNDSKARLILSSYWQGHKDELTIMDGKVGINTPFPSAALNVDPKGAGGIVVGNANTANGGHTSLILSISSAQDGYALIQGVKSSGSAHGTVSINPDGGNVGIGTSSPTAKLSVKGNIRAQEIKVDVANWPDYVFESDYTLKSLADVGDFIKMNKHLPGLPSAQDVEQEGINLGDMNARLLKKIEELTLHLIEKDKEIKVLQKEGAIHRNQQEQIDQLKEQMAELINRKR